nr:hypothetical protein [Tanacetum cinerariifolium]
ELLEDHKAGRQLSQYQFFVDLLKHMDRKDLNQLWALVNESLNNRQPTSNKDMKLWIIMVNVIPPDHVDELPVVEPNQHDDVPVVLELVLVDEDEDPEEEEFEEEEDDMEIDIEEDENEPELTYLYEEVDPLNPPVPASE